MQIPAHRPGRQPAGVVSPGPCGMRGVQGRLRGERDSHERLVRKIRHETQVGAITQNPAGAQSACAELNAVFAFGR